VVDVISVGEVDVIPIVFYQKVCPLFRGCHHWGDGRQCKGFNGVLSYIIFVQTGSVAAFAGTKAKDAYSWKNMDVCFHN